MPVQEVAPTLTNPSARVADRYAQSIAEVVQQFAVAEHPVGDVVAEQDVVGTTRFGVEKGIELGDIAHFVR
jgi:hypothetical protein